MIGADPTKDGRYAIARGLSGNPFPEAQSRTSLPSQFGQPKVSK